MGVKEQTPPALSARLRAMAKVMTETFMRRRDLGLYKKRRGKKNAHNIPQNS